MIKVKKIRGDRIIWVTIFLLAIMSIISTYSASSALAYRDKVSTFSVLLKQLAFMGVGIVSLFTCYLVPIGWYRKLAVPLFALALGFLTYLIFNGEVLNHAARWINIFGFSFQPSEFAKIATILYLAYILETSKLVTFKEYAWKILVPIGAMIVLLLYGSASSAILVTFVVGIILICAKINKKFILITLGIGVCLVGFLYGLNKATGAFSRIDTFEKRIERFFTKDNSSMTKEEKAIRDEKDFQSNQAIEAIQLAKNGGRGPGNSIKRDMLPHPYSDFIYAIIIEEWGIIIASILAMMYAWLFKRCIFIASRCKKMFSTVLVIGLGFLITSQALLHIFVNVRIFPITGQTLPLISLGGTALMVMGGAIGMILSVNRTIEVSIEQNTIKPQNNETQENNN